jgi:hypothetical protein
MKTNKLTHIEYEKATDLGDGNRGEITERYVIPTFVPSPNVKALDVTMLSPKQREEMESLFAEYKEYYQQIASTIFTFEDWISHTQGESDLVSKIKWRTFRLDNVKILD